MYSGYTWNGHQITSESCTNSESKICGGNKEIRGHFYQWRWRREWSPSLSVISAAFIALGRSCLLANTSKTASLNSSWKKIIISLYSPYALFLCVWDKKEKLFNGFSLFDKVTDLIQHPVQLIPCLNNTVPVIAIHHENETLSVLEIVPPQRTDLYLKERKLMTLRRF